jgi:DNA invertase Pin-like site-specific DNA recombinase
LLRDARQKKIDVVLVYKLDRFGRSLRDVLDNIQTLDDAGVRFIVPAQGLDTDKNSAVGRFLLHILGAVAELERSFIVERTVAGREEYDRAYAAGEVGRTKHSRSGKDLPPHRPLRVFRRAEARKLRARGMSWRKIAAKLGVPPSAVRRELARAANQQ